MEFTKVVRSRRSIRKFRPDPIQEENLQRLVEALSLAPSGSNGQPCTFVFIRDPSVRTRLVKEGCHQEGFLDAPLIVVACCKQDREFDCAIAVDHLVLSATNEGLGSCWVGWIDRDKIRAILNIPESIEVPVVIPIGYADESPEARPRKPIAELVFKESYRNI